MKRETIRYQNDREMAAELLEHPDVVRVNEQLEKMQQEGPLGTRRHLLATSVRLSRSMAPEVHALADACIEKLEMTIPHELYVYSSPQFNAACFKPEAGKLFVMFSSSLLEKFDGSELKFVIGHEFGHHVYRHHEIPIGYLLRGQQRPDPRLALDLFAWSRNAEVSADRAGAFCAADLDGVGRALFKLASGLGDKVIRFDLDEFLKQVDEMQVEDAEPGQGAPKEDWFSTHPFSPLRVKALQLFQQSELMTAGGDAYEYLEVGVQRLLSLMEPSYLEARTDTAIAMRRLLFSGAIAVASADAGISDSEIEVFEKFFGKGEFRDALDLERIVATLADRIEAANQHASSTQRMQVMRDICLVSMADGGASEAERVVLNDLADRLGISRAFICQTLEQDCQLD
ncbi:MAG: M48 family metallopeptidase [Gammaproteobacteria bacterium]|nr:M48 family metallopeptidase [Gammaproteobacteria bacterium]